MPWKWLLHRRGSAKKVAAYWVTTPGHGVKLIPPAYVKPYVKSQKNVAADADPVFEAVQRPSMRFVPVKRPGTAPDAASSSVSRLRFPS
jgi:transposase